MKTSNVKAMGFGFSAVNAVQRNVSIEPQVIAVSTEGNFRITPVAVSYTHLDVYKRQMLYIHKADICANCPLKLYAEQEDKIILGNSAIDELRADGTLKELGEKYFGQDISSEN